MQNHFDSYLIRWLLTCLICFAATGFVGLQSLVLACPFCSALAPTLSDDLGQSDVAVFVHCQSAAMDEDGILQCQMRITEVLRGDAKWTRSVVTVPSFQESAPEGPISANASYWLVGYGESPFLWSEPKPVSKDAMAYLRGLASLPEAGPKRLEYFLRFLKHDDELISNDAYNEFADASLEQIRGLANKIDREWVIGQLRDKTVPVHRRRLCWTFLSQCGTQDDAQLFSEMLRLREDDPTFDPGMDAAMSCFISLGGERALAQIERDHLQPSNANYLDCYAAVSAIRVHGTELDVIPRERLATAMRLVLEIPALADMVIPDLARWKDWTAIDRVVELFEMSEQETLFVKPNVVLYLKACPLPTAKNALQKLRQIDPAAVEQAEASLQRYPGVATVPVPPPVEPKTPTAQSTETSSTPE